MSSDRDTYGDNYDDLSADGAIERMGLAVDALDHGFPAGDRSVEDWRTLALVHGTIAIAESVDRLTETLERLVEVAEHHLAGTLP